MQFSIELETQQVTFITYKDEVHLYQVTLSVLDWKKLFVLMDQIYGIYFLMERKRNLAHQFSFWDILDKK